MRPRKMKYEGIGRNEQCPCGSGKKFKKCCIDKEYEPSKELLEDFALGEQRAKEWDEAHGIKHPEQRRNSKHSQLIAMSMLGTLIFNP